MFRESMNAAGRDGRRRERRDTERVMEGGENGETRTGRLCNSDLMRHQNVPGGVYGEVQKKELEELRSVSVSWL